MTIQNVKSNLKPDDQPLKIGSFVFEKVIAKSDVQALDPEEDYSEVKRVPVKVVAWLLDNWQFGNAYIGSPEKSKHQKLKELTTMVESKEIFTITDTDLNKAGVQFGLIQRVGREYQKGMIVVSLDIEQRYSQEDKRKERESTELSDAENEESTPQATTAKRNQAQVAQEESNAVLDWLNGTFKKLWE